MSNEKCVGVKHGLVRLPAKYMATKAVTMLAWLLCCAAVSKIHKQL
ncbi:MAG: hypothetical protein GU356_01340 [Pyrobaculum sp.]|nr:hypothetical protein [Pyrobaculum sp.]